MQDRSESNKRLDIPLLAYHQEDNHQQQQLVMLLLAVEGNNDTNVFYKSNLIAKAPGLHLGKNLSNFLSNHEAFKLLCNILYILPSQPRNLYCSASNDFC